MEDINAFLNLEFLGNTVESYCWLIGLLLLGLIFQKFLSKILSNILFRLLKKTATGLSKEDFFKLVHKPLSLFVLLVFVFFAFNRIDYPAEWGLAPKDTFGIRMVLHRLYQLALLSAVTWICLRMVDFIGLILMKRAEKTDTRQDDQIIPFFIEVLKIIVVIFAIFIALGSVFKINIGSLVAGLGIGGLALALAAKESLENLFGSFTIFFDKPFTVGDLVKVGDVTGIVEKVGFRSTRIRTLEKSFVTVPNKKMIDAELDNLSLRTFRRVEQTIGILYGTTAEKVRAIVNDIQQLIDEHPNTNQDGEVHFHEFGASSLDIMVLYFIDTMDWSVFLKVKEEINYRIMEIVAAHGSDFAYPTQTIHLEKQ
ncbi:MAG: mechanosensitive ion channel family protein [Flavobacteriales bacterium]